MYQDRIKQMVPTHYNPRHIEAFIRCEHGTLDKLSPAQFRREVFLAFLCIEEGGDEMAERVAKSLGMWEDKQ